MSDGDKRKRRSSLSLCARLLSPLSPFFYFPARHCPPAARFSRPLVFLFCYYNDNNKRHLLLASHEPGLTALSAANPLLLLLPPPLLLGLLRPQVEQPPDPGDLAVEQSVDDLGL